MAKSKKKEAAVKKDKTKRSTRGKHCLWNETAMLAAMSAVQTESMSQRAACKTFNVPRCTLQVRLTQNKDAIVRQGRPTALTHEQEGKIGD